MGTGRIRSRVVVATLMAALAGCAQVPWRGEPFRCPARGGPAWVEVSTEDFALYGDVTPGEGRDLVLELEELREAVLEGLFPGQHREVHALVRVIAFRREADFDEFAPPNVRAYLSQNGVGEHVIVMPSEPEHDHSTPPGGPPPSRDGDRQRNGGVLGWFHGLGGGPDPGRPGARLVIVHELTHHVLRNEYPRQPRWFGEGYAALSEILASERSAFGRVPVQVARGFDRRRAPMRELLAWSGKSTDQREHDSAAMLVHYLLNEEPRRFAEFRGRLAAAERPDAAWAAVFPEWGPGTEAGPETLDLLVAQHAKRPAGREWPARGTAHDRPRVRGLTSSEVHAIRLTLTRFDRGDPEAPAKERAEVEEALVEDPDHVIALQVKAALLGLDPLPLAERAAAAHPGDVRAALWLAASLPRGPDAKDERRLAALRHAVEIAPRSAMAANNLAWHLLQKGDKDEALPLAERAAQLAPGDPMVLDTLAGALEAAGRCPDALRTAERALEFLPEGAPEGALAPWTERVERLRASCGPGAPGPSSATR